MKWMTFSESVLVTNGECIIITIYSEGEWCFESEYEGLQPLPPLPNKIGE